MEHQSREVNQSVKALIMPPDNPLLSLTPGCKWDEEVHKGAPSIPVENRKWRQENSSDYSNESKHETPALKYKVEK